MGENLIIQWEVRPGPVFSQSESSIGDGGLMSRSCVSWTRHVEGDATPSAGRPWNHPNWGKGRGHVQAPTWICQG